MNRRTRKIAGTLSSTSLTSSPMRWSAPVQQGHAVVSGSIVTSQRGRCLGKAPILRFRLFRDPGAALVLWSSLAGGGRAASVSASPRPSDNCSAMMTALFSDRAPNRLQRRDRCLQGLDFTLAGEDHLDQPIGVAREVFGAKHHA